MQITHRHPSLAAFARITSGHSHLRRSDSPAPSIALARANALDLAIELPTLLVSPSGTGRSALLEQLDRLNGGAPLPAALTLLTTDDLTEIGDAEFAYLPPNGALVLERADALVADKEATERLAHHVRMREGSGITLLHLSKTLRVPRLMYDAYEVLQISERNDLVTLGVTKTQETSPFQQAVLGLEDGLLTELLAEPSTNVPLLRRFPEGRALLEQLLAATDPDARAVLSPNWSGSLESLLEALEQFAPVR